METALWIFVCLVSFAALWCAIVARREVASLWQSIKRNEFRAKRIIDGLTEAQIFIYDGNTEQTEFGSFFTKKVYSPRASIDRLLDHLGLVEIMVPGTPQKTVIEKASGFGAIPAGSIFPPFDLSNHDELKRLIEMEIAKREDAVKKKSAKSKK